ncbi:MAG: TonB-dependent receptor domain-containing protein [Myxococcota bacterium]
MQRVPALLVVLLALAAFAQSTPKMPVLVKQVDPVFPASLADAGVGGVVVMEIDIGADGKVMDVKVIGSAGPEFDEAAVAAAKQLEFTPAEFDGKPTPVRIQYSSQFVVQQQVVEVPLEQDAGVPVVNLKGQLLAAGTREPIAGATIAVLERTADSDGEGRFEFTDVPSGQVEVKVTAPGFEPYAATEEIKPGERTEVRYALRPSGDPNVTVVRGTRDRREVAQVKLTQQEFRMVAGARNDAFKVVQNLPGVARSPFGGSALVVRGSKAWDSRIYVDEIQIPQLFHFAGLNATFNSATVESIAFQPGNFGVDYGRSIGGLIQAEVKTPSKRGVHGAVDLNFFDVSANVEAPLTDTWSVSAAGRYGLAQLTIPFAISTFVPVEAQKLIGLARAPQFWDYQVRAERRVGTSKNRLFISLFGSSDRWAFVSRNPFADADVEGNAGAAASSQLYNRLVLGIDQRLSDRVTFISRNSIGFDVNEQQGNTTEIFFRATQFPIQLRERFRIDVPEAKLVLGAGLDALITPAFLDAQQPPPFSANQLPDPYVTRRLIAQTEARTYVEPGLFVDATWTPIEALQVRGGLRFDGELTTMQKVWLNPRISARYQVIPQLAFKAGAAMYQQPPDYRTGQLSPVFGNPKLLPEGAWHFMAGAEAKLFDLFELDVQGYYKPLFNQARQTLASGQGSDIAIAGNETRYTSDGYGRAYGGEVLLRLRPTRYFTGWVAYSISRFERDYFGGVAFAPGPLDQPHNLIIVGSAKLPWDLNLGLRFRYASGPLVTPVLGSLFDASGNYYVPLPGLPWSERLPDFFQLDARLDKRFVFDAWTLVAYLDVQNVTNQQNPEARFYNHDYSQSAFVTGIPILPTVGLRGEW